MKKSLKILTVVSCVFALSFYVGSENIDGIKKDGTLGEFRVPDTYLSEKLPHDKPNEHAKYMLLISGSADGGTKNDDDNILDEFNRKVKPFLMSGMKGNSSKFVWKERGPRNVGGRTRAFFADLRDAKRNTWFAGSVSGGIWKTTDRGKKWFNVSDTQLPNLSISSLVQSKSNPSVIYAGTGESFTFVAGIGVVKSTDGGDTWVTLESTRKGVYDESFRFVNRLVVDPKDENTLVVATRRGIFKSQDGGNTWEKTYGGNVPSNVEHIIVNPSNFNIQFASVNTLGVRILKSTDAGNTWIRKTFIVSGGGRTELAVSSKDPTRLYASVNGKDGESFVSKLYVSDDSGENWYFSKSSDPYNWLRDQGGYDNTIFVDPDTASIVFLGGINVAKASMIKKDTVDTIGYTYNTTEKWMSPTIYSAKEWTSSQSNRKARHLEVLFGPGKKQKAHRFYADTASVGKKQRYKMLVGSGVKKYVYKDYVEVPFEVWDLDSNKQLMVSFRDDNQNGIWDLDGSDTKPSIGFNMQREYIFIHDVTYAFSEKDPTLAIPDTNIARTTNTAVDAKNGDPTRGRLYNLFYTVWPRAVDTVGYFSEVTKNIPESKIAIGEPKAEIVFKRTADRVISKWDTKGAKDKKDKEKYLHADQHSMHYVEVSGGKNYMIFTNDGGVFYSEDKGKTYMERNTGYVTTQFYTAVRYPKMELYLAGSQDNGTWSNSLEADWSGVYGGDGFGTVWHSLDTNKIMTSIYYSRIVYSMDRGSSWYSGHPQSKPDKAPFITSIGHTAQRPDLVFTVRNTGIRRSIDFGATWSNIKFPESSREDYVKNFSGHGILRISLANPEIVWAVTTMVEEGAKRSPLVSVDAGKTFHETSVTNYGFDSYIQGISTHPYKDSVAYITFSVKGKPRVLRTSNLGKTWENITGAGSGALPSVRIYDILVVPDMSKAIYPLWAGTELGLFISDDDGKSWHYSNNGLPPVKIRSFNLYGNQVVVATYGRGVWTVDLKDIAEPKKYKMKFTVDFLQHPIYPKNAWLLVRSNHKLVYVKGSYLQASSKARKLDFEEYKTGESNYFMDKDFQVNGQGAFKVSFKAQSEYTRDSVKENITIKTALIKPAKKKATILSYADATVKIPNNAFHSDTRVFVTNRSLNNTFSDDRVGTKYVLSVHPHSMVLNNNLTVSFAVRKDFLKDSRIYFLDSKSKWKPLKTEVKANRLEASHGQFGVFRVFRDNAENKIVDDRPAGENFVYRLGLNYPNPFNPTTQIRYELKERSHVKMLIYNSIGQHIKTLLDEEIEQGQREVIWNGRNSIGNRVASGVYYYQMITRNRVFTKKMILLK